MHRRHCLWSARSACAPPFWHLTHNMRCAARLLQASYAMFRGVAALSGLLATIIFPRMHGAVGLVPTGCAGIAWLNACLLLGAGPTIIASLRNAAP